MEMTGRDIWVYMEADGNGGILPVGLELLTPAQEMARATGGRRAGRAQVFEGRMKAHL